MHRLPATGQQDATGGLSWRSSITRSALPLREGLFVVHYRWNDAGPVAKHGIFPRGEGFTVALLQPHTTRILSMVALVLLAIMTWITCIILLIEVTTQLLDMLQYIVELAQLG